MSALIAVFNIMDILTAVAAVVLSGSMLASLFGITVNQFKSNPIVNTTLVFFEQNKEVFLPIANAGKQLVFAIYSTAITILKPTIKALVAIIRILKPYILFVANVTRITIRRVQEAGMSASQAVKNFGANLWDFGSSLAVVTKGLAQLIAYCMKGLSVVFSSFENVFNLGYRILFQTSQITWEELSSALIPLAVVSLVLGSIYWMKRSKTNVAIPPVKPVPRRSDRIARKRAMLFCKDLSVPSSSSEKSSATASNL
jgi:hypothetical protein